MANRHTNMAETLDRKVVSLFGVVTFGGGGAVSTVDALGFTVTKPAGTGIYRITLEDLWNDFLGGSVQHLAAAAADVKFQWQVINLAGKIIDFQNVGGAVAADATSGHRAYIVLHLRNTSTRRKGV
jgi:hypothetical protein